MKYDHVPEATSVVKERANVTSTVCGRCGARAVRTVRHGHAHKASGNDQMNEEHWQWRHEQARSGVGQGSPWRKWNGTPNRT